MKEFWTRHQKPMKPVNWILAGAGACFAIGFIRFLTFETGHLLIIAPFGATAVLLFSAQYSPLSQPINVIGGHVLATLIAIGLNAILPDVWWAMPIAVGVSITAMAALRITHPPAGADPIVVFTTDPGLSFVIFPVLSGAVVLVLIAIVFHKVYRKTSDIAYPIRPDA